MSTESNKTPVVKKEEFLYPATEKGELVLTVGLQREIEWLHKQVGPKEWCGVLFYKRVAGDIDYPKSLKLVASHLYLMDIGREAYTEADMDDASTIDMWDTAIDPVTGEPDYTYKRGLIHTHHNMTTFFSGTDMSELHDNVDAHNYYLSLIVNFSGVYSARVAFAAKRNITMEYTSVNDENKVFETSKELLVMIDMNITKEQEEVAVPDFFRTRYTSIKTQLQERATAQARANTTTPRTYPRIGAGGLGFEDYEDDDFEGLGTIGPPAATANPGRLGNTTSKSSSIVTPEGNLEKNGKILKPLSKVEQEIAVSILAWLNEGTNICSDMASGHFNVLTTVVDYFRAYFDEPSHDDMQYKFFINQLQRDMPSKFKRWFPILVQRVGMELFDIPMLNNPVAGELYELFESYPQYLIEMGYLGKNTKDEKKDKKGSKHKRRVNARSN